MAEVDDDLDLTKELWPLAYYLLSDRKRALQEAFKSLKGKRLEAMIPPVLKKWDRLKLESACLSILENSDDQTLLAVLEGQNNDSNGGEGSSSDSFGFESSDSSVSTDSNRKIKGRKYKNKRLTLAGDGFTEVEDSDSDEPKRKKRKRTKEKVKKLKKKLAKAKKKKKKRESSSSESWSGREATATAASPHKSLMELLELEYRSKAIKALLRKQGKFVPDIPLNLDDLEEKAIEKQVGGEDKENKDNQQGKVSIESKKIDLVKSTPSHESNQPVIVDLIDEALSLGGDIKDDNLVNPEAETEPINPPKVIVDALVSTELNEEDLRLKLLERYQEKQKSNESSPATSAQVVKKRKKKKLRRVVELKEQEDDILELFPSEQGLSDDYTSTSEASDETENEEMEEEEEISQGRNLQVSFEEGEVMETETSYANEDKIQDEVPSGVKDLSETTNESQTTTENLEMEKVERTRINIQTSEVLDDDQLLWDEDVEDESDGQSAANSPVKEGGGVEIEAVDNCKTYEEMDDELLWDKDVEDYDSRNACDSKPGDQENNETKSESGEGAEVEVIDGETKKHVSECLPNQQSRPEKPNEIVELDDVFETSRSTTVTNTEIDRKPGHKASIPFNPSTKKKITLRIDPARIEALSEEAEERKRQEEEEESEGAIHSESDEELNRSSGSESRSKSVSGSPSPTRSHHPNDSDSEASQESVSYYVRRPEITPLPDKERDFGRYSPKCIAEGTNQDKQVESENQSPDKRSSSPVEFITQFDESDEDINQTPPSPLEQKETLPPIQQGPVQGCAMKEAEPPTSSTFATVEEKALSESDHGEEDELPKPVTWYERWAQKRGVQKFVKTNKIQKKVRTKLKGEKKAHLKEKPEIPVEPEPSVEVEPVIGSIAEYEKLFGKKVVVSEISVSNVDNTTGNINNEEEEDDAEDLWGDIIGAAESD